MTETIATKELRIERLLAELSGSEGERYATVSAEIDALGAEINALLPRRAAPTMPPPDRSGITRGGPFLMSGCADEAGP